MNTQNKELHPLVTLLQHLQKMHGMNNLKYSTLLFKNQRLVSYKLMAVLGTIVPLGLKVSLTLKTLN